MIHVTPSIQLKQASSHLLVEAARVALEAGPEHMIRYHVSSEGEPIEIPPVAIYVPTQVDKE